MHLCRNNDYHLESHKIESHESQIKARPATKSLCELFRIKETRRMVLRDTLVPVTMGDSKVIRTALGYDLVSFRAAIQSPPNSKHEE